MYFAPKTYSVYIMSNRSKTLYVGTSSELEVRVWKHKHGTYEGFTSKYKCDRLVYFEDWGSPTSAIAREKQIKGWTRIKKIALIVSMNPEWRDLSEAWGKPIAKLQPRT